MMNNTEVIGLARKAVDLPGWKWHPGLWIVDEIGAEAVVLGTVQQGGLCYVQFQNPKHDRPGQVPGKWCNLNCIHPATGGVLYEMLGEHAGAVCFVGATAGAFGWTARRPGESPAEAVGRTGLLHGLAEACVLVAVDLGGWP